MAPARIRVRAVSELRGAYTEEGEAEVVFRVFEEV